MKIIKISKRYTTYKESISSLFRVVFDSFYAINNRIKNKSQLSLLLRKMSLYPKTLFISPLKSNEGFNDFMESDIYWESVNLIYNCI